jgi:hypothetical protein
MAEEYWHQEEQKAEKDYLFLTSAATKHKALIAYFLLMGVLAGYFFKIAVLA